MSQAKTFECYPDVFERLRGIDTHLKELDSLKWMWKMTCYEKHANLGFTKWERKVRDSMNRARVQNMFFSSLKTMTFAQYRKSTMSAVEKWIYIIFTLNMRKKRRHFGNHPCSLILNVWRNFFVVSEKPKVLQGKSFSVLLSSCYQ